MKCPPWRSAHNDYDPNDLTVSDGKSLRPVGYILSSILSALLSHQRQNVRPGHPLHPDPAHLVAHYLRASSLDDFEVQIRVLKTGKGFTNLGAEFWQAVSVVSCSGCLTAFWEWEWTPIYPMSRESFELSHTPYSRSSRHFRTLSLWRVRNLPRQIRTRLKNRILPGP